MATGHFPLKKFHPFTAAASMEMFAPPVQGNWLTEKPFGVIISLMLSFIALGRHSGGQKVSGIAFAVALIALLAVIRLATTKMPLLGFV